MRNSETTKAPEMLLFRSLGTARVKQTEIRKIVGSAGTG
jgi:hypothetical protein